jgi:hypothetical protein
MAASMGVNQLVQSAVRQLPAGKNVNMEAEDIVELITRKLPVKTALVNFRVCELAIAP